MEREKMTVRQFIAKWADGTQDDIDVYDNVCEELGIAYCGGIELTKAGEEQFKEVLDYEIEIETNPRYSVAIVDVDKHDWKSRLKKAKEFFYSAAGYCADTDYEKWFKEV